MHAIISIPTDKMEQSLQKIAKQPKGTNPYHEVYRSAELELIQNGFSSMQNKLKAYLCCNKALTAYREKTSTTSLENYICLADVIDFLRSLCMSSLQCEENETVDKALECFIYGTFDADAIKNVLNSQESQYRLLKLAWSNNILEEVYQKLGPQLYGHLTPESQRRQTARLLTRKEPKHCNQRKLLVKAAYILGMTRTDINLFLQKAAFTSSLDWNNPWDFKVAYLSDSGGPCGVKINSMFDQNISMLDEEIQWTKSYHQSQPPNWIIYQNHIWQVFFSELIQQYQTLSGSQSKSERLIQWAWQILLYQDFKCDGTKFKLNFDRWIHNLQETECCLAEKASQLYQWINLWEDSRQEVEQSKDWAEWIECQLDRRFQLLCLLYEICAEQAERAVSFIVRAPDGVILDRFSPAFQSKNLVRIQYDFEKLKKKDRMIYRSDLIHLGIELDLERSAIDRVLQTGGFYSLYPKDIFEYALLTVLTEEKRHPERLSTHKVERIAQRKMAVEQALKEICKDFSSNLIAQIEREEPSWMKQLRKT